ncbi:hypothetical protein TanjilG_07487 [Lupinus angustifolius]|uniref:Pectin acetylesterase n=1 Tax=Lupinus angustifolius TaxID=3871 RepID=A0A4P1QUU1_LUPAN|nr:hypothetical protein TanjilG_07487 [Lupinus angustifolius]
MEKLILVILILPFVISARSETINTTHSLFSFFQNDAVQPQPLTIPLTLIQSAASKGAVCLDGTLPGYHFHPGSASGANSWLIQLEIFSYADMFSSFAQREGWLPCDLNVMNSNPGNSLLGCEDKIAYINPPGSLGGGWCNTIRSCVFRKTTRRGSSKFMEKQLPFTGILSNKAEENPDFFNWNRIKVRYCDGASFSGDSENESAQLQFRGQKIWLAAMDELMSKGMNKANQALLSGCSAGGVASIIHCDEFRNLFPQSTKVKCLSDAGFFLDAVDVSGGRPLRNLFGGVVNLQGVQKNLPQSCLSKLDPTSCFFPQNLINHVQTPLFLLNAAYDAWQVQESLAPPSADPHGSWNECKSNHAKCNSSQIQFLQDFRNQMLNDVKGFSSSSQTGLFINSCFAHCQSERQDTWFADDSPLINNKPVAIAVGDWYFDRQAVKAIDCAYPCDTTCHNLVFK